MYSLFNEKLTELPVASTQTIRVLTQTAGAMKCRSERAHEPANEHRVTLLLSDHVLNPMTNLSGNVLHVQRKA